MGGIVSSVFGKKPQGPSAFRNPDYIQQGDLASDIARSAAYQSYFQPNQSSTWAPQLQQWGGGNQSKFVDGVEGVAGFRNSPLGKFTSPNNIESNGPTMSNFDGSNGGKFTNPSAISRTGWQINGYDGGLTNGADKNYGDLYRINQTSFTPGQEISGQLGTTVNPYEYGFAQYNPYNFNFGYNPNQQVADAFIPQAIRLNNLYQQNLNRGIDQQAEDFNRRGLLQSGGLTEANRRFSEDLGGQFLNSLAGLAGQQAQTQTQAGQFGAQINAQRQQQQAEELFRNVGANNQMAQSLASLGFNQALSGRQAAVNEQLQGINSQQNTLDNLLRLYAMSAGANTAQPGTKGIFGSLAPIAGAVVGGALGGPAGAAAGGQIGSAASAPFSYGGFW